jgi:hypothetical protein
MTWIRYRESSSYIDIGEEATKRHAEQLPNEVAIHPVCRVKKSIHGERYARLVEAAPDLLAVCKELDQFLSGWCPTQCSCADGARHIHDRLSAAIKKSGK